MSLLLSVSAEETEAPYLVEQCRSNALHGACLDLGLSLFDFRTLFFG